MRHAAGQPSDGFHLLRLMILFLQRAALGDVLGNPDAAHRFAVLAEEDPARAAQPPHRAVGPDRSVLDREIGASLHRFAYRLEHATPDRRDESRSTNASKVPPKVPGCRPYWASRVSDHRSTPVV